jgi:histidyl-tRNA synthetase
MSKGPQRIRGTQDIWGEASDRFQKVVETFDRVRRLYGFRPDRDPGVRGDGGVRPLDRRDQRHRLQGDVHLPGQGRRQRHAAPEFTAGICRAYLSEGWQQHAPMKSPPTARCSATNARKKGRFRQFHQLDAEIIGTDSPLADVELLTMADQLLHELGIADGVTLQLNTLGDARRAMPGARLWSPTSRRIAATCPKTAWSGSRRTRFASSTARTRATGPRPTARPASMIS